MPPYVAPGHQDLAVGQQGGRVPAAGGVEGAGGGPGPGGRVVELGAGQKAGSTYSLRPPGPCRWAAGWPCGHIAAGGEGAGGAPGPGGRVVELGAVQIGNAIIAARHQDLAVGQQGGGVVVRGPC